MTSPRALSAFARRLFAWALPLVTGACDPGDSSAGGGPQAGPDGGPPITCPAGTLDCPCGPDDFCEEPLECRDGVCREREQLGCDSDCNDPPAPTCIDDETLLISSAGRCEDGRCVYAEDETRCDALGCDTDEAACASCDHACDELDESRCADGEQTTCDVDERGCRAWSVPEACEYGVCDDAETCCSESEQRCRGLDLCDHGCDSVGETRCDEAELSRCEEDSDGCRAWSEPDACEYGACDDERTCASCQDECPGPGTTRCRDGAVTTCETTSDGCLAWAEAVSCDLGECGDAVSCATCDHGCPALGATSCTEGMIRSCVADEQGCRGWSGEVACPEAACANETTCELSETFCTADDWCWVNPRPHGQDISVINGASPSHVTAAAQDLGVMLFDGATWRQISGPNPESRIKALGGTGPTDIWGCELWQFHHYDGTGWRTDPYGASSHIDCESVYSLAPDDAVSVGGSVVSRWDGTRWTQQQMPVVTHALKSVDGTGPDDIWVLGDRRALHWDGNVWDPDPIGLDVTLVDYLTVGSESENWIGESSLLRFSGGTGNWTEEAFFRADVGFAVAAGHAWFEDSIMSLRHYEQGTWTTEPLPEQATIYGIWGSAPDDVWSVGSYGALFHWNGSAWQDAKVGATPILLDLWVSGTAQIALDYDAQLWTWNGETWEFLAGPEPFYPQGMAATALDDVWIVGEGGVLHYDGQEIEDRTPAEGGVPSGAIAFAPDDAWVSTQSGEALHWDGMEWTLYDVGTVTVYAMHGTGPDDIWIAGSACEVFHWDGEAWNDESFSCTTSSFSAIVAVAENDVWVAGSGGAYHWNGSQWSARWAVPDSINNLRDLWASGPSDVYAVGDNGRVSRFNGVEWSAQISGATDAWFAIDGTGAADVWIVGSRGHTLRRFEAPGPCNGMTCSGKGTCAFDGSAPRCECEPGTHAEGLTCQDDPDPCDGVDCSIAGHCHVVNFGAECACNPGPALDLVFVNGACVDEPDDLSPACDDGQDDEGDGWTDCDDRDCVGAVPCRAPPEGTFNGASPFDTLVFDTDGTCQRRAGSADPLVDCLFDFLPAQVDDSPDVIEFRTDAGEPWDTYEATRVGGDLYLTDESTTHHLVLPTPLAFGGGAPTAFVDLGSAEDDVAMPNPTARVAGWHVKLEAGGQLKARVVNELDFDSSGTVYLAGPLVGGVPQALLTVAPAESGFAAVFDVPTTGEYLVLLSSTANQLRVHRHGPNGAPATYYLSNVWESAPLSTEARGVAIADLDGDGRDDVVVTTTGGSGTFSNRSVVFLQSSDGTLAEPVAYGAVGSNNPDPILLDVTGDEIVDITYQSSNIQILSGNGDGTFAAPLAFAPGGARLSPAIDPLGGLGFVAAATTHVVWHRGDAAGDFSQVLATPGTNFVNTTEVSTSDLDDDGVTDVVLASGRDGYGTLDIVDGRSHHLTSYRIHGNTIGTGTSALAVGDVFGDASPELVVSHYGTSGSSSESDVYQRRADGRYEVVRTWSFTLSQDSSIVDVDVDGRNEFVGLRGEAAFRLIREREGRWVTSDLTAYSPGGLVDTATGDVDGDGCTDVAAASRFGYLVVAHGNCPE